MIGIINVICVVLFEFLALAELCRTYSELSSL